MRPKKKRKIQSIFRAPAPEIRAPLCPAPEGFLVGIAVILQHGGTDPCLVEIGATLSAQARALRGGGCASWDVGGHCSTAWPAAGSNTSAFI